MLKLIRRLRKQNESRKALRALGAITPAAFINPNNLTGVGSLSKAFRENASLHASLAGQKLGPLGRTPFMAACARGDVERVIALKDLAAPEKIIDIQDNEGITALVHAIINGHNEIVNILLNEGKYQANPNLAANFGYTPLEQAIEANNVRAVKLLIGKGVDVNQIDEAEFTPLMIAAGFGRLDISRLLINNGADVNILRLDDKGNPIGSALFDAIEEGHYQVVKLLLDMGADRTLTIHGRTALESATGPKAYLIRSYLNPEKGGSRNKTKRLKQRK